MMNDERALLSAMLVFNDCIPKVSQFVTAEDFLEENHRRIFNAFVMHYADGIPVELSALGKALKQKNDMAYIAELMDIATTGETAPYYARQVKLAARLRRITQLAHQLATKPDDIELAERLTAALVIQEPYYEAYKNVLDNLTRFSELSAEEYIIEWVLDGIIPKGAITLFFGRGGIGKSTLATQIGGAIVIGGYPSKQGSDAEKDDDDANDTESKAYCFRTVQKTRFDHFKIWVTFNTETYLFDLAPDPDDDKLLDLHRIISLLSKTGIATQTGIVDLAKEEGLTRSKTRSLLKRGDGKYWVSQVDNSLKRAMIYTSLQQSISSQTTATAANSATPVTEELTSCSDSN